MSAGKARVQQSAPPFQCTAVVKGTFEELSLSTFTSTKQWLVLGFIPMAWTFVCPTEIIAFHNAREAFRQRGATVVFASTDSEYSLLAWNATSRRENGLGNIDLPLLSDKSHKMSRDYGVLIEDEGIALRGLFLIDPQGLVRQITINDLSVGRSVDETLRLIDAYQHTDRYGEVCPIGWQTGQEGLKTDTEGRKAYLEKTYGGSGPNSPSQAAGTDTHMFHSDTSKQSNTMTGNGAAPADSQDNGVQMGGLGPKMTRVLNNAHCSIPNGVST